MSLPPVTEEDKPTIERMVRQLNRLRKREHNQGKKYLTELDDAIASLHSYGALKGWWEFND